MERNGSDSSCTRKYDQPMIQPFMNYLEDSTDGGWVTHRLTSDSKTLYKAKTILAPVFPDCEYFNLDPKWAYIITWFNKTTFASTKTPGCEGLHHRNTLQAIVVGGLEQLFTIFLYRTKDYGSEYKTLEWSFPPSGCTGKELGFESNHFIILVNKLFVYQVFRMQKDLWNPLPGSTPGATMSPLTIFLIFLVPAQGRF
jgi:hypothetical protein